MIILLYITVFLVCLKLSGVVPNMSWWSVMFVFSLPAFITLLTLVFILVTVINILFSLYEIGGVLGKDNKSK